jgi:chromosome partitioning protein
VAGLDLAPASGELVVLDKALYGRPGYEFRLREALTRMSPIYDFVLLDCPPSFGTLTLNALTAAHLLIIPIQCEYYAWRSLRSMLDW